MAERWDLTIFEADRVTPVLGSVDAGGNVVEASFSTDPAHPRPYLDAPNAHAESSVDLLKGAAKIGQYNLVLADVAPAGDQDGGAITAILSDADGQSAINGRRGLLRVYRGGAWMVAMDGVLSSPSLDNYTAYPVQLRDVRERERKLKLFQRTGTATVLPRGVLNGYGKLPNGEWLVPPTEPLPGVFRASTATTGSFIPDGAPTISGEVQTVDPDLVVTEAMLKAGRAHSLYGGDFGFIATAFKDVKIGWRAEGSTGDYTWLEDMPNQSLFSGNLFGSTWAALVKVGGEDVPVQALTSMQMTVAASGGVPTDGQRVEVVVVYVGPASKDYPYHFEGTAGEFLQAVHNGEFSGDLDTGLTDEEAAVLALDEPARIRAMEVAEDARAWLEKNIYQPIGAAPALDLSGRVSPIRYRLPADGETVTLIDDAIVTHEATWSHPSSNAVNVVRFRYPRDFRVPASEDPAGERSAGDGLASREVEHEYRFEASIAALGEQAHEIETVAFRSLGGEDGASITGDVLEEGAAALAAERARQATDRYLYGGQIYGLPCRWAALPSGLRVGDWVEVGVSYLPEYATHRRGANRLCQIVEMRPVDPALVELVVEDAGPANQPLTAPTLGIPTAAADGTVSIPVDAIPAGAEARVDCAISATEPAAGSGLWTFAGRIAAVGDVLTPPVPAGSTVWVRGRSEAVGRRPSGWTAASSVVAPSTPRVNRLTVSIGADGAPVIEAIANQATAGYRIYADVHGPDVAAAPVLLGDYAVTDDEIRLDALTVRDGEVVTVEVEPWTTWDGSAVGGTAGARLRASSGRPPVDASYMLHNVRVDPDLSTPTHHAVIWDAGPLVTEVWGNAQRFVGPQDTDEMWDQTIAGSAPLDGVLMVPIPAEGETSCAWVQPAIFDPVTGVALDYGGWHRAFYGAQAPIVLTPSFAPSADGTEETLTLAVADPRGVTTTPQVTTTTAGVATVPVAMTAEGSGRWTHTYALHPKHDTYVRVVVARTDGLEPLVRVWTADRDQTAEIQGVNVAVDGTVATVQVEGDTDCASLYRQEKVGELWSTETLIAATNVGSFVTETKATEVRLFRVYGKNAAGLTGPMREVGVSRHQHPGVVRVQASETANVATLTLEPIEGAIFDTVEFSTREGGIAFGPWTEDVAAPYSAQVPLHEKHDSAIRYRVSNESVVVQEGVVYFDVGDLPQVKEAFASPNGEGTAAVLAKFDSDADVGAGNAEWRVDGGASTAAEVAADRTVTFDVAQLTTADQLVEVRARNARGAWGDWFPVPIPQYVPIVVIVTEVNASLLDAGSCAVGVGMEYLIEYSLSRDGVSGYSYEAEVSEGGAWLTKPTANPAPGQITMLFPEYEHVAPKALPLNLQFRVRAELGGVVQSSALSQPVQENVNACA